MNEVQKELHPLDTIEVDGQAITFEDGMLLCYPGADAPDDCWHVMLLRVSPREALQIGLPSGRGCTVLAVTQDGKRLSGRARPLPFRSASDCMRLIGISSLRETERQTCCREDACVR